MYDKVVVLNSVIYIRVYIYIYMYDKVVVLNSVIYICVYIYSLGIQIYNLFPG